MKRFIYSLFGINRRCGKNIHTMRRRNRVTLDYIAEFTGIPDNVLLDVETECTIPLNAEVQLGCEAFGSLNVLVTPDSLKGKL